MQVVRGLPPSRITDLPSAVAIGNFDGVHRGHLGLVARAAELAQEMRGQVVVVTFEPLTREFFAQDAEPARLQRTAEKLAELCASEVDMVWLLRFDRRLAELEPQAFLGSVLLRGLDVRHLVMGSDFRFGRGRTGGAEGLRELSQKLGFSVNVVEPVIEGGVRVSSTEIRKALQKGDFELATALLGRPYQMMGRVVRGRQLGRTLGYPTANLRVKRAVSPLAGIFAVWVHGAAKQAQPGVASLGSRPTLGDTELLLESHLFDFEDDIYGRRIKVEFVAKLRDEVHFDSLDKLTEQMNVDARQARDILSAKQGLPV